MPHDWIFDVESILIRLVPAYTLEALDQCDVERILPYYFYDYRKALRTKKNAENPPFEDVVIRNGKKYRKVTANQAKWANDIF